jgi:hypothetical protein
MYSKLFCRPARKDSVPETRTITMVTDSFDYAGACLSTSSDEESVSLQTVLVLDFSVPHSSPASLASGLPVPRKHPEYSRGQ